MLTTCLKAENMIFWCAKSSKNMHFLLKLKKFFLGNWQKSKNTILKLSFLNCVHDIFGANAQVKICLFKFWKIKATLGFPTSEISILAPKVRNIRHLGSVFFSLDRWHPGHFKWNSREQAGFGTFWQSFWNFKNYLKILIAFTKYFDKILCKQLTHNLRHPHRTPPISNKNKAHSRKNKNTENIYNLYIINK